MVILGPGSEKKWYSTHEYKPQGEWDRVAEQMVLNSAKADTQSFDPQVHCLEECSKAKVVENCQYTSVPMGRRLKLFFAQLFLLISSVCTEQSQICVKNVKLAMSEQGDLLGVCYKWRKGRPWEVGPIEQEVRTAVCLFFFSGVGRACVTGY